MTSITAANLPREARALLDAIAQGESDPTARQEGISPYVILYGGSSFEGMPDRPGYYGFPDWPGKDNSHAAGRYQFEPATWKGIADGWPTGTPNFRDPGDQDWGAWFLAQQDYSARANTQLLAELQAGRTAGIADTLKATWTSLSESSFPARYRAALLAIPETPTPTVPPVQPPVPVPPVQPPAPPVVLPPSPQPGGAATFSALVGQIQAVVEDVSEGHEFVLTKVPKASAPDIDQAYKALLRSALMAILS